MFCPKCGANNENNSSFCSSCGAALPKAPAADGNQSEQQSGYTDFNNIPHPEPTQQPAPNRQYSFQQRSIAVAIILSIVTCGIYGIYWLITIVNELNEASGSENDTSGAIVFLLGLITCNIYTIYWMYKAGEKVNRVQQNYGAYSDSSASILYLVLALFGLEIVSLALIQNELNKAVEASGN